MFILVRRLEVDQERWFIQTCDEDDNYYYETNDPSQATVFTFGQAESYRMQMDACRQFRTDPRYQWVERFDLQPKSDFNTTPFWLSAEEKEEQRQADKPKWRGTTEIANQQKEDAKKAKETPARSPNPFASLTVASPQAEDETEVQPAMDTPSNPFRKDTVSEQPPTSDKEEKRSDNPFLKK